MYRISQLRNGLKVATVEMPQMQSVSLGVWVGVGSRFEAAEANGICHFIEHLLFKGTARRTASRISQEVEGLGGYLNAFTSEESTCFHARAGWRHFDKLLDVLMDMLLHSRFAPADIRKEREVIKEEIAMYLDEPQHLVQELLNATLWPGQPLGRSITGTAETLNGMGRDALLGFFNRHYTASTVVIVASGRVQHHAVVSAVEHYGRRMLARPRTACAPTGEGQSAPRLRVCVKKTEQAQIALGIRTCSRHDRRRYALRLLNAILGENMSSRLFQEVREERGLAYSIYSSPSFFADTGDLVISVGLDPGKLGRTMRLILRELRRFSEDSVSVEELGRARDYALGQIDLGRESTESQMNWMGEQILGYGRVFTPSVVKRHLARVTAADIRTVARDFFRPERLSLAIVNPSKSSQTELESILRRGLPI